MIKHNIPKAVKLAGEVADWLLEKKRDVVVADECAPFRKKYPRVACLAKEDIPAKCDMVIVFGGDGTFLSIARQMI
ncbi:MAG: NAD(+)/NADH kinase, partial [Bdellovibrionales bacterium]|nr:NAD(+)/NADH kinase [Bdellovibrionales bacterium]